MSLLNYEGEQGTRFGCASIDYITLTTFHECVFEKFVSALNVYTEGKQVKVAGRYTGYQAGQVRYGVGTQSGAPHFVMEGFGIGAEWVHDFFSDEETEYVLGSPLAEEEQVPAYIASELCSVTRIDIQVSSPKGGVDFRDLKDAIETGEWGRRGKPPSVTLLEGVEKKGVGLGNTIYVGTRKSDKFVRIYDKPNTDTGEAFIRFEVQFQKKLAFKVATSLAKNGPSSILRSIMNVYPHGAKVIMAGLWGSLNDGEGVKVEGPSTVSGHSKRYLWAKNTVLPATYKHSWTLKELAEFRDLYLATALAFVRKYKAVAPIRSRQEADKAWEALKPFMAEGSSVEWETVFHEAYDWLGSAGTEEVVQQLKLFGDTQEDGSPANASGYVTRWHQMQ